MIKDFEKRGYRFHGTGAVEICRWTKNVLTGRGACYKQKFYGAPAHKCMEFAPSALYCNNNCVYCWRPEEFMSLPKGIEWTDPKEMVESLIKKRLDLLWGLKGNPKTNQKLFLEAKEPSHFAISLSGEPTNYGKLPELIDYIANRKGTFSIFLVTNGQYPDALEKLKGHLPTQIYLSLTAPNKESYKRISVPTEKDYWERLMKSCEFVSETSARTVARVTLIKGMNMIDVDGWVNILKKTNAHFIEFKGYSWIGYSRIRLKLENVPTLDEIKEFVAKIMKKLNNYKYEDEEKRSRILLFKSKTRPINRMITRVR